jgi:hypothetical protein
MFESVFYFDATTCWNTRETLNLQDSRRMTIKSGKGLPDEELVARLLSLILTGDGTISRGESFSICLR